MMVKYVLNKSGEGQLTIGEYSPLDKKENEVYTLLYEEKYDGEDVKAAIERGKGVLMSVLRTSNLYPQDVYASKLCDVVTQMYADKKENVQEIIFDDYELLTKINKGKALSLDEMDEDIDEENVDLDDLLDDDDDTITNIKTSIQVADDDVMDIDKDDDSNGYII